MTKKKREVEHPDFPKRKYSFVGGRDADSDDPYIEDYDDLQSAVGSTNDQPREIAVYKLIAVRQYKRIPSKVVEVKKLKRKGKA